MGAKQVKTIMEQAADIANNGRKTVAGQFFGEFGESIGNFFKKNSGEVVQKNFSDAKEASETAKNIRQYIKSGITKGTPEQKQMAAAYDTAALNNRIEGAASWMTGEGSLTTGAVRIGGTLAALGVGSRLLGPGDLTTDAQGNKDIAGIPFI